MSSRMLFLLLTVQGYGALPPVWSPCQYPYQQALPRARAR
jgi:hypothetical protein